MKKSSFLIEALSVTLKAVVMGTVVFMLLFPLTIQAQGQINIVSGPNWTVSDANGNDLGNAQNVCLDGNSPTNCPTGATEYGYSFGGWNANLSSIPGATWIWAPNITGRSSPAANAEFTFKTSYYICCDVQSATISIAADNSAEVAIDNMPIPGFSSVNYGSLTTVNIPTARLSAGFHMIKVKVRNGANGSDCASDQYQCNPAGMVFGASIKYAHPLAKCSSEGKQYDVGYNDMVSCTKDGRAGLKTRLCACFGCDFSDWIYFDCTVPACQLNIVSAVPSACDPATNRYSLTVAVTYMNGSPGLIDINGKSFPSNGSGSETFVVPNLVANGINNLPVLAAFLSNSSCSALAVFNAPAPCKLTCIGSNGVRFDVGATETLPCPTGAGCGTEQTHTCLLNADGRTADWGALAGCKELAQAREKCWDTRTGENEKCCPVGFHCERFPPTRPCPPKPWWCLVVQIVTLGIANPCKCDPIVSTEFICVPD
jgi:hypothetical protein